MFITVFSIFISCKMLLRESRLFVVLFVSAVSLSLVFAATSSEISFAKGQSSKLGVTKLNKLGNKINGLETPSGIVTVGNVITCPLLITCVGTNHDDIIYAGAKSLVFGLNGNDIVYSGLDDQVYGGKGNDLLIAGPGRVLLDGGPADDVLLGGLGNNLLVGGSGNDKLFAGTGSTVMFGGSGANHFDCPLSVLGLAKTVVMDYNPTNGDTIAGSCKIVNTIGSSTTTSNGVPQVNLPDTGETDGGTSSGSSSVIPGTSIGAQ
jgi:hypothetical protein